ncbi:DUF2779 domain-containing protein [Chloroflexota bacterium]
MRNKLLSKSKYISGLQCPKYLWMLVNSPKEIPQPDAETQYIFDQGHKVGELATKLYPDGIYLVTDDFMDNIWQTKDGLKKHKPLFEAGIFADGLYSRLDILNPVGRNKWDIIEVKSSTSLKDVNIHDVSFQKLCCDRVGIKIRKCKLAYVNNQYVKNGEIDPKEFFIIEDITSQVEGASEGIEDRVSYMLEVISGETCPESDIGKHCCDPYDCMLLEKCWEFLPENNIFDLRGGKTKQFSLFEQGILSIKDIPDGIVLSRQQQIQRECVITGNTHVEKGEIRQFLDKLEYPLYYLDFETIGPAIPIYDGMRPYQTIPFQFSLHVVEGDNSKPIHYEFLADGKEDPRPELLSELYRLLGFEGSIIAYNSGFEEGVLMKLIEAFPEYTKWYRDILVRIVDLLKPFSNFHFYHVSQKDTASLKKVLPAVTGKGYEEMGIGAGMDASIAYERITYNYATEDERSKVRADLLKYCKLDTEGMIWIIDKLREICR